MLKLLHIFELMSKFENFDFWTKFGLQALVALGKRLYQKFLWASENIVQKDDAPLMNSELEQNWPKYRIRKKVVQISGHLDLKKADFFIFDENAILNPEKRLLKISTEI